MGINFSHWDTGVSHRTFHTFRFRIADAAGIPLRDLIDTTEWRDGRLDVTRRASRAWEEFTDPIVLFLKAFDTEASFTPQQCRSIKRRLQEIASGMHESEDEWVRVMAFDLATAMSMASFMNESFTWIG